MKPFWKAFWLVVFSLAFGTGLGCLCYSDDPQCEPVAMSCADELPVFEDDPSFDALVHDFHIDVIALREDTFQAPAQGHILWVDSRQSLVAADPSNQLPTRAPPSDFLC